MSPARFEELGDARTIRTSWTGSLQSGTGDFRCTFDYMTGSAAEKLAAWELAMKAVHAAERELEAARRKRSADIYALRLQVEELRTRADLLLAEAVKARHHSPNNPSAW
jgi:hypothetical protein